MVCGKRRTPPRGGWPPLIPSEPPALPVCGLQYSLAARTFVSGSRPRAACMEAYGVAVFLLVHRVLPDSRCTTGSIGLVSARQCATANFEKKMALLTPGRKVFLSRTAVVFSNGAASALRVGHNRPELFGARTCRREYFVLGRGGLTGDHRPDALTTGFFFGAGFVKVFSCWRNGLCWCDDAGDCGSMSGRLPVL